MGVPPREGPGGCRTRHADAPRRSEGQLCVGPKRSGNDLLARRTGLHNGPPVPTDLLSPLCQNPSVWGRMFSCQRCAGRARQRKDPGPSGAGRDAQPTRPLGLTATRTPQTKARGRPGPAPPCAGPAGLHPTRTAAPAPTELRGPLHRRGGAGRRRQTPQSFAPLVDRPPARRPPSSRLQRPGSPSTLPRAQENTTAGTWTHGL